MRAWPASILALLAALAAVGGCGLLPTSGPESWDIRAGQHDPQGLPFALVRVTPSVTSVLEHVAPRLIKFAEQRRPKDITFGVGDVVTVTIFEATAGGLFIPSEAGVRPGNFVTIPSQAVDSLGNISIPYAGNIRAKGRTPVEVEKAIVDALKNRAIEPQVVVSLVTQQTSLITVLGDVGHSSRVPASAEGERILDVIARAGGPSGPGPDEWVMLERSGQRAVAPFGALIDQPANNVWIHANDTIYLYREPQTFLAFGALGQQQQLPFGAWRLTLAEAIAKAGGLNDAQADPASVFLYRGETREVAQQLGVDTRPFASPIIPIIYNFNLRNGGAYFLATNFEMRNKDVILVSDSVSVESTKFMTYLNTINGTINDPITTALNVYSLKGIIAGTTSPTISVGGSGASVSDIRLKRDITKVSQLDNGLSLYRFRYLWSETFYVGVMAQEVERLVPDAVIHGSDGYLRVNYGRLGLQFMTWDEWLAAHQSARMQAP